MTVDWTPTRVLGHAATLLDRLGIAFAVGGSFASSVHGIGRSTQDVDVTIDLRRDQIEALAGALEPDYYVSREAMDEAVRDHRSFNAIHLYSMFKIDFFVLGTDAFDREEFGRGKPRVIDDPGAPLVRFITPEDVVLRKLRWYRAGREVSDQQWRDVLGVLLVCRGDLDERYMNLWAAHLGVSDLLERARAEVAKG